MTVQKRFVVTGAASGIGRATAQALVAAGAQVLALDLQVADMPEGVDKIAVDVTDVAALEAALLPYDGFDGIATFAGLDQGGGIESLSPEQWRRVFEVNVFGTAFTVKAALRGLVARAGAVVLCSSQLSMAGAQNCVAYAATKGAINAMTKALALDLAAQGIRVNAIAPGATMTPMMERAFAGDPAARLASQARHALGRFGRSEESAAAALFLLGGGASFISGSVLPVDGGWLAK